LVDLLPGEGGQYYAEYRDVRPARRVGMLTRLRPRVASSA
jgi:hypothetical protein